MAAKATLTDYEVFELGDFELQSGTVLPQARLAYRVHGPLSAARDNVVVYPTAYGQVHTDCETIIGPGHALDPARYCIVVPNMFGNGVSSSPSNTPAPFDGANFPVVTIHDMVRAQHRLLTEGLGVEHVRLVTGTSMGGLQSFEWGAAYPDYMDAIVPRCGAARCWPHDWVFLEGVKAALTADPEFRQGRYTAAPERGLRTMARVWAGWAYSQAWFREERWRDTGAQSLAQFLDQREEQRLGADANNLVSMIHSWQHANIASNARYEGDFDAALRAIKARAIVMPGRTDLYFPPEDNEYEVARMPNAEVRAFESIWGHIAGGPSPDPADARRLERALRDALGD